MKIYPLLVLASILSAGLGTEAGGAREPVGRDAATEPAYDAAGRLLMPSHYREWIYLTSGLDMNYNPKAESTGHATADHSTEDHSTFDNVFVEAAAYRAFQQNGTWPDKTMIVLENRAAMGQGSINRSGHFQGAERTGFEVHVRDEVKTPGKWAFYDFDGDQPAEQIPAAAACYSCHEQHAAVATTFVQFYPTLLPIARKKQTLSAAYLKEEAAKAKP